ncbi:MAG: hypothetical protein AB7Y46_12480 [Armatimonadota bacterium]
MPDTTRPLLKICGLTRLADVRAAEAAGADFCGLIVEIERSPRALTREQARLLARGVRARPVLVVEEMPPEEIAALVEATGAAAVQLHGGDAGYVAAVAGALGGRAEVWRPVGLPEQAEDRDAAVAAAMAQIEAALAAGASAIVLDTRGPEGEGGTGRTCDWGAAAEIVRRCRSPVILAGGLSPANLAAALHATGAAGLDLSSSLERAPGLKCPLRLRELGRAWRQIAGG